MSGSTALLFLIVFAETGFVVTPFLPGDSLLFAAGALCAAGALSAAICFALLALAAFAGNAVNYTVGRFVGPRIFTATDHSGFWHNLLNRESPQSRRTHSSSSTAGRRSILGRFVPIVRTFVPFVAGAAQMTLALVRLLQPDWRGRLGRLCLGAGLLFGNVPIVKENFSLVTIGIVGVSLLPAVVEYLRHRSSGMRRPRTRPEAASRRVERLREILLQILDVLEAGGNPHQAVGDAERVALLGRHRGMGHRRRMRDQGLDAAEALRQRHQPDAVQQPARRLERTEVEREHAAEARASGARPARAAG